MGLDRPLHTESATGVSAQALLAHIPARLCLTCREETDEIRHVAAADEEPAAIKWIADQLCNPSHGLRFDFRGGRRQDEGPDVRVDGRREKIAEDSDRRR